ncbi:glycosyltransferase family 4 protein [Arthrobacter sp. ISL-30]|uniref:glycosyltransferase family 4 protein n=1 Tax=Arthrobacter sp. ISL-30 TaxID=2819109 RepID=UPI001BEA0391|nr:glycosyltransferase family 4 protein [Arthrobacter sp. ISL-30]MBT2513291.1 glycosyltransferase family 4 protein [Arthrobacter sp. ISL-30]
MTVLRLIVPGNVQHRSGGNIYNARLAEHVAAAGITVRIQEVDGDWPVGSEEDRRRLGAVLSDAGNDVVLVDGLIGSGAPKEIEQAAARGNPPWILVHMALADHPELEKRALTAAAGVICTSSSACRNLQELHGLDNAHVVVPGVDLLDISSTGEPLDKPSGAPPHLVVVAALLPHKAQLLVVEAFARLRDLPWTAALVGSTTADPDYALAVIDAISRHGLQHRIEVTGERSGEGLEQEWRRSDLSLLVSTVESFGMVVTESIAHGVPVLVRAGIGAVEALGPTGAGTAVELDDDGQGTGAGPEQLEAVLRTWLTDPKMRHSWRAAALQSRDSLPSWEDAAAKVLSILDCGA